MTWRKLGHVFVPNGSLWWARSYASFPTVDVRADGRLRVYFTALDEQQDGRVGYLDVAAGDPRRVISATTDPVLDIGDLGEFDDCGANAFGIATVGSQKYLYYQGWQRTTKAPFLIFSGLAVGDADGSSFRKVARVPILDRTRVEPYLRGAPYVLREGGAFRMWYVSCTAWSVRDGVPRYRVVVRVTTSADGLQWDRPALTCLEPQDDEYAIGRPCVVRDRDTYRMWYSIRSHTRPYRIGYAESRDGTSWTRLDGAAGLERSGEGWDSEMVCYGYVVDVSDRRYLFFNGNRHGSTGFGVAEWLD